MKLSVIVPIYNSEKYLPDCLKSILNQDCPDFELILINDGSTDGSLTVCNHFQQQDSRITVLNKKNGGSTSSRKMGIAQAKGEYIVCIDSDDYLEQGYFSKIVSLLNAFDADILSFGYYSFDGKKKELKRNCAPEGLIQGDEYEFLKESFIHDGFNKRKLNSGSLNYSLCTKVIKKQIFAPSQSIIEDKITIGEDMLCFFFCLSHSKNIYCTNLAFYNYRKNNNSVMRFFNNSRFEMCENTVNAMHKIEIISEEKIQYFAFSNLFACKKMLARVSKSFKSYSQTIKNTNSPVLFEDAYLFIKQKGGTLKEKLQFFCFKHNFLLFLLSKLLII